MLISGWSSDVCSADLWGAAGAAARRGRRAPRPLAPLRALRTACGAGRAGVADRDRGGAVRRHAGAGDALSDRGRTDFGGVGRRVGVPYTALRRATRDGRNAIALFGYAAWSPAFLPPYP